jgi:hypothetical protein
MVERLELVGRRQLAVEQKVCDLEESTPLRELIHRITPVQEHALTSVYVGDLALAAPGRRKAGVIGKNATLGVERPDINDIWTHRAGTNGKLYLLVRIRAPQKVFFFTH